MTSILYFVFCIWKKTFAFLRPAKYQIPNTKYLQRGFIKITKHLLINYLIVATIFFGGGLFYLFNPFGTKSTEAAWFNDNWGYRKEAPVTSTDAGTLDEVQESVKNLSNFTLRISPMSVIF